jgi:predicted RNase H-like nuclease
LKDDRRQGITFDLDAERLRLGRSLVSRDDIIDAAAMLVSARRIRDDKAAVLSDNQPDARGLLMQMWA